ncbi:ATP-binding response regulator [Sphingobacterium composti Ten et al. 2007 non Yoo et al. 2007]|uniref:ATP-binding response regulator n=1 Tax=Sphingobacterium composti TaxID=363260 RepID=UPI001359323E|nr:ATP-binding protein [Sphingobacterium composti Ten et al. 2007 non Yoo et al. 2007]
MPIKKTFILRLLLLLIITISFVILCSIFASQYRQYKEIEHRLNIAYANNSKISPTLYELFSTISEVDNSFRLYAISFEDQNFKAYQQKLDTLHIIINSLDSLSSKESSNSSTTSSHAEMLTDPSLSMRYIALKKQIDELIIFADKNLAKNSPSLLSTKNNNIINADSVINRILNDSSAVSQSKADTIIRKKEGLIKRIFNAKNDTILNSNNTEILNVNQIDIVHKNIENLIRTYESSYKNNYGDLRNIYLLSKEQERKLITSNYALINDLKKTIEEIREIEELKFRNAEKDDYFLYKLNTEKFRSYAILALCVILLMLLFIIYYQYVVSKYEQNLIKEKDYASQLAEEKTSLLANISHEIRTPLNSLKGVIKLLSTNQKEDIDEKMLFNINYDINLINNTVNDILNLSKIESESIEVVLESLNISQIIHDTYSLHSFQASQKGITYINDNRFDSILKINSNEFRLRQIISNLISNAIKYTKKGSVKVVSQIINDKITIDVIDTGIGIEEQKIDQVFRKYYTVDGDKSKVGFGLGLHISQLLAKQIGGKLSVKSQFGKGSTFTLQIPLNNSKISETSNTFKEISKKTIPKDIAIVLIDDNKINLLMAKQTFSEFTNIEYFENAKIALSYIEKTKPAIVITDIVMPKVSGWDVLNKIKSNKNLSSVKVIAQSAEGSLVENRNHTYNFDGILDKSFNPEDLAKIYFN